MMKWNSLVILSLAVAAAGMGCANKKSATASAPALNDSVTEVDIAPVPPHEPSMAYTAPLVAEPPAAPAAPIEAEPAPVVSETPVASSGGNSYTVKKGDTLFSISREFYGNGGQWQRIASANPGLSPSTLKAGTTIAIP